MHRCSRRFLSTLALAAAFGSANAAELGEARVSSHIGQPLVADIELAMVDDPVTPVSVRLASPEVYNGAGIAMPPVLASVNLSVMKRDGRQFLHVTSLRPVEGEHLHLYLELVDKGQRTVRLATLWLTADPNPAPAPAPVPAPLPAAKVHAEPAPMPVPAPVLAPPRPQPKPAVAKLHAAPKVAMPAPAPAPQPLPIHAPQPAAPAACAQQAAQAKVCAALDGKNAALKAEIGKLEGKVQALRQTLGMPVAASASASAASEEASLPAAPKPISAIKPLVPRKPKAPAPAPDAALPWGWIGSGAAVLLALGGSLLLLRRRVRTVQNVDIPAEPRLIERLRERFAARTKPAAAAAPDIAEEAVEPTFD
jgi:hypothetical protein